MRKRTAVNCLWILLLFISSAASSQSISLSGSWGFAMDRNDEGVQEKWFLKKLDDTISLPGSMNSNNKGDEISLNTKWTGSIYDSSWFFQPRLAKYREPGNIKIPFWLTPLKHYVGAAWYQKQILIPSSWSGKKITLFLERTHIMTRVWIDGNEVNGIQNSLSTPHEYDLTKFVKPVRQHTITIRIDNRIRDINVGPDSHSVSDHTQGNWNGVIGRIQLRARVLISIDDIQVFPNVEKKLATVKMMVTNNSQRAFNGKISLSAKAFNTKSRHSVSPFTIEVSLAVGEAKALEAALNLGNEMLTWDEFDPNLYKLTASLGNDSKQTVFGMREIKVRDKSILINGRPAFLRGDLNNCEFPLTGYPAMDVEEWKRIFGVIKNFGLNHIRFHSWCPPEAAFNAADEVGIYLQPEAPTWPNHGTSLGDGRFIDQYIYDETERMVKVYGNHPSFVMLAAGNEPAGKNQAKYLAEFIRHWKTKDNRRIYTGASVAMSWPLVPENEYMIKSGPRGLNWNNTMPESISDYRKAVENFSVPYITHEQGQWCAFPDFKEIKNYTGAYRARNFELFREDLSGQGLGDEGEKLLMASGKLQALCYKYEIEKSLRTPGLSGFQLLGLQDFPGQGTALVGVLNAFYGEKGYINSKEFSRFCNTTVPLIRTKKFVYKNNENFDADVELFHFGKSLPQQTVISWTIKDDAGILIAGASFPAATYAVGNCLPVGKISYSLSKITQAIKLKLEVKVDGTSFANDWNIFVYPSTVAIGNSSDIYYTDTLDQQAEETLKAGGKVFLRSYKNVIKGKEVVQYFTPVFWNTSWFKMRPPHTLGILVDPNHPVFKFFPTGYHSDLQWWEIVNRASVMHLEDFPKTFRPLIQPIDTWFMNRRLAMLFEVAVGKGKLIVCSADLQTDLENRPAARQLLYSIERYMLSPGFNPTTQINLSVVRDLFQNPSRFVFDAFTKDSPDELKPIKTN